MPVLTQELTNKWYWRQETGFDAYHRIIDMNGMLWISVTFEKKLNTLPHKIKI